MDMQYTVVQHDNYYAFYNLAVKSLISKIQPVEMTLLKKHDLNDTELYCY